MSDPRHTLGVAAEEAVAHWLARVGWVILGRRVRAGSGGEVDLIALDPAAVLVAVEVRARRTDRTGAASTTVDRRRLRRLQSTLVAYAVAGGAPHTGLRIDLVTAEPAGASDRRWRLRRLAGIGDG